MIVFMLLKIFFKIFLILFLILNSLFSAFNYFLITSDIPVIITIEEINSNAVIAMLNVVLCFVIAFLFKSAETKVVVIALESLLLFFWINIPSCGIVIPEDKYLVFINILSIIISVVVAISRLIMDICSVRQKEKR